MGLPIWRDPDEVKVKKEASVKPDPTAAARSPIRRRSSIHGRRSNRARLPRDPSTLPPRFERSPPPSTGFNGLRNSRRSDHRGVPPVSTLLESADRRAAPRPPPPVPDPRRYELQALDARERELRSSIAQLQGRADRLDREARAVQSTISRSTVPDYPQWSEADRQAFIEHSVPRRSPSPASSVIRSGQDEAVNALVRFSQSRTQDVPSAPPNALPTPPHDAPEDADSLFIPEPSESMRRRLSRRSHPLSNSWRPESPVNGLGDRNRSPTPADGWEIMRTTITPDATLPSADSSFTSAAASHSFTSSNDTNITEPDRTSSPDRSRRNATDQDVDHPASDSGSSIDPEDLVCNEEERQATASFAEDMYLHDQNCPEGRARIVRHYQAHTREGNRYALFDESDHVEIGFRLIDEALYTDQGRERVLQLSRNRHPTDVRMFEEWMFGNRRHRSRRTRRAQITDDEPPSPHPERYSSNQRAAVREASGQVHDYFRRFTADALMHSLEPTSQTTAASRPTSPPPRYEPLASHPDVNTFTSRTSPQPHPVSPPSARSERDIGDALLSGDEQDLNAVRRVVERLARRDDVPDEWWMSMGLNLSRTGARSRSPMRQQQSEAVAGERVRNGRVARANSHL